MAETRLEAARRLLAETEKDLDYALSINDEPSIKALTREVVRRQAKVTELENKV